MMDSLPETGNINLLLLKQQALKQKSEAIRELSRYFLKYAEDEEQFANGKLMLLAAAHMADRGASWLLAIYYRTGKYGFDKDTNKSDYWRECTEKRLRSDSELIYDDMFQKDLAINRYNIWTEYWNNRFEVV